MDMKTKLDEKVGKLRSQMISFANDGIQVSLNIPDTSDVKETFDSVINTVMEQHDEIQDLHTGLETTATETVASQEKLLAWTASCIQKLKEDNERLQAKLLDANKQIKNLSYNMQGYVDTTQAEEGEAEPEPIEFDELPQMVVNGKGAAAALFPTEEGADPDQGASIVNPSIRRFGRYKSPEQQEKALAMYRAVPPNTLPDSPPARWRWAIRKVMSTERKKRMKVGLTRSRMDPKQTFAGRLDRIEATMLNANGNLQSQLAEIDKRVNHKVDAAVTRINTELSATAGKLNMLTDECGLKLKALQEEVAMVDATMNEFFAKVQQQASGDTQLVRDTLQAVEAHLRDTVHIDLDAMRSGVAFITTELDGMESTADKLLQRVESLHAISTSQPPFDPAKPIDLAMEDLTDLLQVDTQYREARQDLVRLQASLASMQRAYDNVHQHVTVSVHHYTKESVQSGPTELVNAAQLEDLNDLSQRCVGADGHIKHIDAILCNLDRMCLDHDKVLKDRLKIFTALSGRVRDLGASSEQLTRAQSSRLTRVPSSPAPVVASSGGGLTMEQVQLLARFDHDISELNLRVGVIEGMNALEDSIGFEPDEVPEQETEEYTWRPPPVVPQGAIVQERVVSEKSYSKKTFADLSGPATESEVRMVRIQESPPQSPKDGVERKVDEETAAVVAAPFSFRAAPPQDGLADAPTEAVAMDPSTSTGQTAAAVAAQNTVVSLTTRAFSPATAPGPGTLARKGSAFSGGGASEKRRGTSVTSLDMLEARLRPLIEKIVAANVDERLQHLEGGMGGNEGFDDGDEAQDPDEGRDAFPAEPPAALLGQVPAGESAVLRPAGSPTQTGEEGGDATAPTPGSPEEPRPSSPSTEQHPPVLRSSPTMRSRQSSSIEFSGARIRREASRFGALGDSGKLRMGSSKSGRGGVDITPYVNELSALKKENSRLGKALGKLEEGRLSADDVERMFHHLMQAHHQHEQKEESRHHIHELERRVENLTKEISTLHASHVKAIANLQSEFTDTLHRVVNAAAQSFDAENKESFVSTRALCLGCGRNSLVRAQPEARPMSPSFFPQINQHSTEGPDVYHAGFKLPVKNPLNPTYVLEATCPSPSASRARAVKSAGQRMQEVLAGGSVDSTTHTSGFVGSSLDAVLPKVKTAQPRPHTSHHPIPHQSRLNSGTGVNIEDDDDDLGEEFSPGEGGGSQVMKITGGPMEDASRLTATENGSLIIQANKGYQLNISSSTAPIRATSAVKVVRSARPEAEELRPVYKKGFPGKKSLRAETAFAHDRYELDMPSNILLQSTKLTNAALVPGTEGVVRLYTTQEGSRSRPTQSAHSKMSSTTALNTSSSSTRF